MTSREKNRDEELLRPLPEAEPSADDPDLETSPLTPPATGPPFRAGTVSVGPFDAEPFELQSITWTLPNGKMKSGPDLNRCLSEWLTGALESAGVGLGSFERLVLHILALDERGTVQAVAGWVARAARLGGIQAGELSARPSRPDSVQRDSGAHGESWSGIYF